MLIIYTYKKYHHFLVIFNFSSASQTALKTKQKKKTSWILLLKTTEKLPHLSRSVNLLAYSPSSSPCRVCPPVCLSVREFVFFNLFLYKKNRKQHMLILIFVYFFSFLILFFFNNFKFVGIYICVNFYECIISKKEN